MCPQVTSLAYTTQLDVVIFGGGIAGLWLLDRLVAQGHRVLLLEKHTLGSGQTVTSQGIIHGGLKYSLAGVLTPSAKTIAAMPQLWRSCLAGEREPDLSQTKLRSDFCFLWRTDSLQSKLGLLCASKGLRVRPVLLPQAQRPPVLRQCPGQVMQLDEQVICPVSLIANLAKRNESHLVKYDHATFLLDATPDTTPDATHEQGRGTVITLPQYHWQLRPRYVVFCAGEGNEHLRQQVGLPGTLPGAMQRRPLHMVLVKGKLPVLNGHCADGAKTRVTITTAPAPAPGSATAPDQPQTTGDVIWQVGGQIAEDGVNMSPQQLIAHTYKELQAVLPGLTDDLSQTQWATYRVDRAEAAHPSGLRPQCAFAKLEGHFITAWPTKLVLTPVLSDMIIKLLPGPGNPSNNDKLIPDVHMTKPSVAIPPWQTQNWQPAL